MVHVRQVQPKKEKKKKKKEKEKFYTRQWREVMITGRIKEPD